RHDHAIQFDLSTGSEHAVLLQGHVGTRRSPLAGPRRRRERTEHLRGRRGRTLGHLQSDAALRVSRRASRTKRRGVGDGAWRDFPEGLDQLAAAASAVSHRDMRDSFMIKHGPAKAGRYVPFTSPAKAGRYAVALLLVLITSTAAFADTVK